MAAQGKTHATENDRATHRPQRTKRAGIVNANRKRGEKVSQKRRDRVCKEIGSEKFPGPVGISS
jgi:hypothetical protein